MMRRLLTTLFALCLLTAFSASAQTESVPGKAPSVDSTLIGKSIFNILPSKGKGARADVTIHQSQSIQKALGSQISSNSSTSRAPGR